MTNTIVQQKPDESSASALEDIELSLFVKAMQDYYGYDFGNYQLASLKRRVMNLVDHLHLQYMSELIPKILHQEGFLEIVMSRLSIGVTELFRDPWTYLALKERVFPILKTYPNLRVWHAGCSTGEEVFSLSILLKEVGLLDHATLYASDFNVVPLEKASSGILHKKISKEDATNYQQAGGLTSLADYFTSSYGHSKLDRELLKKIAFEQHNLVHDGIFCEVQLVMCRNVLIYFNQELQNKVLQLLSDSLVRGGFLVLGPKESLMSSPLEKSYKVVDGKAKIYQKNG